MAEADRFGNLLLAMRSDLNLYGKTEDQAKAIIGEAAKTVAGIAGERGLPLVPERLDLKKRKADLEAIRPSAARKLWTFSHPKAISMLKVGCFRAGVEGIEVDPAYSSGIGAVNHARRHGMHGRSGRRFGGVDPGGKPLSGGLVVGASPGRYSRSMGVLIQSTDDLLAALREHPEWREAVRREILTEDAKRQKPSEALAQHRDSVLAIAARYGINHVRVFGSVARGEDTDNSDLDLLVEVPMGTTLLDVVGLREELESVLHVPVHVLTPLGIHPRFRDRVLSEARML